MKAKLSKEHLQKQKVKAEGSDEDQGVGGAIEMNTIDIDEDDDDEVQVVRDKQEASLPQKRKVPKDVNADCNFDVT